MKREVYERQKAYAGELKPSMQRRCVGHDYTERMMYMVTMVTEGRRPLFGRVVGRSDAEPDSIDAPRMELTELGKRVADEWHGIPCYYPQIEILALQMMPDHLHGILFVREAMDKDLSRVIRGFKTGCNRAYRELFSTVVSVATQSQQTEQPSATPATSLPLSKKERRGEDRSHGFLFAPGYNDKLLLHEGQLQRWLDYLADNPRRLLLKRERPDLLRVRLGVEVCGRQCSAVGNLALLAAPQKLRVRISRSISPELLAQEKERLLAAARAGAVLVSPSISPGEKAVTRAAFDEGLPLIVLLDNGLDPLQKPGGERFRACSEGRLLLLSPFPHRNQRVKITREVCETLNGLAWEISGGK